MGCAKDIVEHVGVPRFLFSDFPLGNAAGKPKDVTSQAFTMELALKVLETAPGPRTTVQSPLRWSDDPEWKLDISNVDRLSAEEIERRRREFAANKEIAKERREESGLKSGAAE
jgi:D-proline reductase (dithiol) PrdB